MTIRELISLTGQLPNRGSTKDGVRFEVDVIRNGALGYKAVMWEVKGLGVKELVIEYGTGQTPDAARECLKNKILNFNELF